MNALIILLLMATPVFAETGVASWYGKDWHGKKTANGERYDMYSATCAHKKHSFGTKLKVINRAGKYTICRVNNRGPFIAGRIVDLSFAGATELGMVKSGTARVTLEVVRQEPYQIDWGYPSLKEIPYAKRS